MLVLCSCSNQTDKNKEGASFEASSALGLSGAESEAQSDENGNASTVKNADDNGENSPGIRFDDADGETENADENGKSEASDSAEKGNSETTGEDLSEGSDGFELPKVPVN